MPIMILSVIVQLLLVVHILKTRRNTTWVFVVIAIPLVGTLAYIIVEILPSFLNSHKGQKTQKNIQNILNPDKNFNDAISNYDIANTVSNATTLADECMNKEMYVEAQKLYKDALKGLYKYDPHIMFSLARAEFKLGNYKAVQTTLNQLMDKNPDYRNVDAHMLFAMALEGLGENESAIEVYEALESYSPTPEALFRHAMLHKTMGNSEASQDILHKIIRTASISGEHHNSLYKEWIQRAKSEII